MNFLICNKKILLNFSFSNFFYPKFVVSVAVEAEESFRPKLLANSFRIRWTVLPELVVSVVLLVLDSLDPWRAWFWRVSWIVCNLIKILNSRKIWVAGKFFNFHTVQDLPFPRHEVSATPWVSTSGGREHKLTSRQDD